jgi:hypothetical protein
MGNIFPRLVGVCCIHLQEFYSPTSVLFDFSLWIEINPVYLSTKLLQKLGKFYQKRRFHIPQDVNHQISCENFKTQNEFGIV